ncbi:MAG: GNAT family N-acetyltransferase [Deltaproteobacteria bacterium]|nr:GNAT family N-acetyltransferase [Deltaproteobacteria bacterium]
MLSWDRNKIVSGDWSFEIVKDFSVFNDFDCNDPDLNDFIRNEAKLYRDELIVETYEFHSMSPDQLVAFVSLANDSLSLKTNRQKRIIPNRLRHSQYPAVKIARLGVKGRYQRGGVGTKLINIVKELFTTNNRTGCRFVTVDAYNQDPVIRFYLSNDFKFSQIDDKDEKTRMMYLDLKRFE